MVLQEFFKCKPKANCGKARSFWNRVSLKWIFQIPNIKYSISLICILWINDFKVVQLFGSNKLWSNIPQMSDIIIIERWGKIIYACNINTTSNNKLIKKSYKQIITGHDLVISIFYEWLWHFEPSDISAELQFTNQANNYHVWWTLRTHATGTQFPLWNEPPELKQSPVVLWSPNNSLSHLWSTK